MERRVSALEASQYDTAQTLRWVVAKLGGIAATQDEHTLQLERIDSRLGTIESKSDKMNFRFDNVAGLIRSIAGWIALKPMQKVCALTSPL